MLKKHALIILLLSLTGFIFGQNSITISVSNIEKYSKIYIGLYNSETSFKQKSGAIDSFTITPESDSIKLSIKNIQDGTYAVAIFQDINNNGKLDTGKFRIPTEPVGISNYTDTSKASPPQFKKAKFLLRGDTLISIPLIINKKGKLNN